MVKTIVFDIDGTLSILCERLKYLDGDVKDWDNFYAHCGEDEINKPVCELLLNFLTFNNINFMHDCIPMYDIYYITGRRESTRSITKKWFREKLSIIVEDDRLLMRPDGDFRHDTEVKPELLEGSNLHPYMIFEDRGSMVEKWRQLGYTCLQVAEGNF